MSPSGRSDPQHFDGGASCILAVLTLYGRRSLTVFPEGASALTVKQDAGSMYMATMCSMEHQVGAVF
jgi:hypothetical protein